MNILTQLLAQTGLTPEAAEAASNTITQLLGTTEALLVALALNAVGFVIKKTPFMDNRWIPLSLCLLGGILYPWLTAWTGQNVLLGVIIGAGAVGFHQLYTQHFNSQTEVTKGSNEKPS